MLHILTKKRGQFAVTWETVMLLLAVVLVIFIFAFWGRLASLLSNQDDPSLASFDRLAAQLDAMARSDEQNIIAELPVYLANNRIIVGFDKDWVNDLSVDGCFLRNIPKPTSCLNQACICLYDEKMFHGPFETDDQYKDRLVVSCKPLPNTQEVNGLYTSSLYLKDPENLGLDKKNGFAYLVLYGKVSCPSMDQTISWDVKNVYLEKSKDSQGKVQILIAKKSDRTEQRKRVMQEKANDAKARNILSGFVADLESCKSNEPRSEGQLCEGRENMHVDFPEATYKIAASKGKVVLYRNAQVLETRSFPICTTDAVAPYRKINEENFGLDDTATYALVSFYGRTCVSVKK